MTHLTQDPTTGVVTDVDRSAIRSVYSGRRGCMCGCRGNHRYASAHVEESGRHRGYPVSPDETSDRSVTIITNKVLGSGRALLQGDDIVYWDDDERDRSYVIYLAA